MAEGIALAAIHVYHFSSPYDMPTPIEAFKRKAQAVKGKIMNGKKRSEKQNGPNSAINTDHSNIGTFKTSKIARLLESRKQKEARIEAQRKQLALQQEVRASKASCIAAKEALKEENSRREEGEEKAREDRKKFQEELEIGKHALAAQRGIVTNAENEVQEIREILQQERASHQQSIEDLVQESQRKEEECENQLAANTRHIQLLKDEKQQIHQDYQSKKCEADSKAQENNSLKTQIKDKTREAINIRTAWEKDRENFKEKANTLKKQLEITQSELDQVREDETKAKSDMQELDAQLNNTKIELDAAETRASSAETALAKLNANFKALQAQHDKKSDKLAETEISKFKAETTTKRLLIENTDLTEKVKKSQQACKMQTGSLVEQAKAKTVEIEKLKAELDEMNSVFKKVTKERDAAQQNKKKLGDELQEVQSALNTCRTEIAEYQNDSAIFDEHLAMLQHASTQQNARYEALKLEMEEAIADRDRDIERLESEASTEEVKMQQAEFEIEQLQERLRVEVAKHEQVLKDARHADPLQEKLRKLQEENKANLSALVAITTGISDADTQQGLDNAFRAALSTNPDITPRGLSITQQNIFGQEVYSDLSSKPCGRCTYRFYLHGALRIQRPNGLMGTDIGEATTFNNPLQKPEPSSLRNEVKVDEESNDAVQCGYADQKSIGEDVNDGEPTEDESSAENDNIEDESSTQEDPTSSDVSVQARPVAPEPFIISDSDDEDSDEEGGSSTTEDSEAEDSNSSVTEYSHDFKTTDSYQQEDKENDPFVDDAEAGAVDYFDPNYDDPDFDWEVEHYDG